MATKLRLSARSLRRKLDPKGITLIELIAVAVGLGVLALIVAPNVENALGLTKNATFATELSELQSASDNFYATTNAYPTYSGAQVGNQPGAVVVGGFASEINPAAEDANGVTFEPGYVRQSFPSSAASIGLNTAAGTAVYWGVVSSGRVFATQVPPTYTGYTQGWQCSGGTIWKVFDSTHTSTNTPTSLAC